MNSHRQVELRTEDGAVVKAIAPVIVSASRATDLPAFHAPWLFDKLDKGYSTWTNRFNGKSYYVSYKDTRFIVFWSKNPEPLIEHLPRLHGRGIGYYIQFTLNDYERDGLELNVPSLQQRIDTFRRLSEMASGSVIWRFDPLILTDKIGIAELLEKIRNVGCQLRGYTEKLVFSFADISGYRSVAKNLRQHCIRYKEWDDESMLDFAKALTLLNDSELHLTLATCAEPIDLSAHGIEHNRCIDPDLIRHLTPDDLILHNWLYAATKDKGQRHACGCILSKDIGTYNTCPHGCLYCYANN